MTRQRDLKEEQASTWFAYANCLGVEPDLFFPERGQSSREALNVCRGCVVRDECLEYALTHGERHGVWGGKSERQRRRIRRQRTSIDNQRTPPPVPVVCDEAS